MIYISPQNSRVRGENIINDVCAYIKALFVDKIKIYFFKKYEQWLHLSTVITCSGEEFQHGTSQREAGGVFHW